MDKKTIIAVVILAILAIFYWPILEFLGFAPTPEEPPRQSQQPGEAVQQTSSGSVQVQPTDRQPVDLPADADDAADLEAAVVGHPDAARIDSVIVETGKYQVILSSYGGGPVSIVLKEYAYRDGRPIEMLTDPARVTPEARFAGGTFSTSQLHYDCSLAPGVYDATRQPLEVVYSYSSADGGRMDRKFQFYPDRHHFDLSLTIPEPDRLGLERKYDLVWNTPLATTEPDPEIDYEVMEAAAMMGGSREKLDDFKDDILDQRLEGETSWGGLRSKYFAAVLIPQNRKAEGVFASGFKRKIEIPDGSFEERKITAGIEMPFASVNQVADTFRVFVGPLDYMMMAEYGVGLEDMLDIGTFPVLGWLIKPFAIAIIWLLPKMYDFIPNYGLVIIIFALLVKVVTLPLSLKSFKSMQAMKGLQPKVEELKKKHKKDAQKLNKEMMKLYKEHGVNPMSGCLPILPQMPLFFALFAVFRSTILLRDAPFIWFIDDLSRGARGFDDPYILLVVFMVVAQFVSQKFTMATTQQNKAFLYIMPLFMGFIFYKFAAGLVLYWTSFSVLSLLDYLVFKRKKANRVQTA